LLIRSPKLRESFNFFNMPKRIERVNELIKEIISRSILEEIEFSPGVLVTVTRVETAGDLLDTNVFISVLPDNKRSEAVSYLRRKTGQLQKRMNESLNMKPIPRLNFLEEKGTAEAGRIEELLVELKKEKK
jgi:ribosome-binding factor A